MAVPAAFSNCLCSEFVEASMKRFSVLVLLLASLAAAEDVEYVGGTVPGLTAGSTGQLNTTAAESLLFVHSGTRLEIPYKDIKNYRMRQEVKHHIGVLPAIAVGMVRHRKMRHVLTLNFMANGEPETALFEVPKTMPEILVPILQARALQACRMNEDSTCVPLRLLEPRRCTLQVGKEARPCATPASR
jgi:hypothetical protein